MDAKMIATSKWLSYVLRYGAAENGLQKRPGGWIKLSDLEAVGRSSEYELLALLGNDTQGRFQAFCHRGKFWVRAIPGRGRGQNEEPTPPGLLPQPPPPPLWHQAATAAHPVQLGGGHATSQTPQWNGPWDSSLRPNSPVWIGSWVGQW
jgi:RNA:NAD 2'-phosphotransferase (TPT1/KptA family)